MRVWLHALVIISWRHGFLVVKTRKTASTSVELALRTVLDRRDVATKLADEDEALAASLGLPGPQNAAVPLLADGTSTLRRLVRSREREVLRPHTWLATARRAYGAERIDALTTFAVVRDPWERAVSMYWWRTQQLDERPHIDDFVLSATPELLSIWPSISVDGVLGLDAFVRFEHLDDDLRAVLAPLGITLSVDLPHAKSATRQDRRPAREQLSAASQERIAEVCAREIEAFGYG